MLKIADWDKHFENHKTRILKNLDWVLIPNKMDGDGYTELVDHPDGAAHYGVWIALLLVASKSTPRGDLARSGGVPHDCASLARVTRLQSAVLAPAIARLLKIGWMAESGDNPAFSGVDPAETGRRIEQNRTEENRREETLFIVADENNSKTVSPTKTPLQELIYQTASSIFDRHPKHRKNTSLADVESRLAKIAKPIPSVAGKIDKIKAVDAAHAAACQSTQWSKENGEYVSGLRNFFVRAEYENNFQDINGRGTVEAWPGQLAGRPAPGLIGGW